jgi:hypothetical protein
VKAATVSVQARIGAVVLFACVFNRRIRKVEQLLKEFKSGIDKVQEISIMLL